MEESSGKTAGDAENFASVGSVSVYPQSYRAMPAKSNKKLPSEWKPGDLCWAKMRGYPTWPGVVLAQPPPDLLLQRGLCPQVSVPVVFFGTRD